MSKNFSSILWVVLVCTLSVGADTSSFERTYEHLERLKKTFHRKQDQFEQVVERRWRLKEEAAAQKQTLKDRLDRRSGELESLYGELARLREENILRRGRIEDLEEKRDQAHREYEHLLGRIGALGEAFGASLENGFPLGRDSLFAEYTAFQKNYSHEKTPRAYMNALTGLMTKPLMEAVQTACGRHRVVAEGSPRQMETLRLGHALAWGVGDSLSWYLNYYGENRSNPFRWQPVRAQQHARAVWDFPLIREADREGPLFLPVDVVRSKETRSQISAREKDFREQAEEFIRKGGFMMIPLFAVLLWGVILIINRLIVYHIRHKRSYTFLNRALVFLEAGDTAGAKKLSDRGRGVMAQILHNCLEHSERSRDSAEKAVKEILLKEVPLLDKHLDTLAVIAASAPLMGLLGTVTGMIRMFNDITEFGTGDPQLLAGGISEALVTTETGLIVAIPILLIHTFLRNRRNRIQADMEMYAMRILNRLWPAE
ncbi:MAG: MotA/TolQ/ExbB proton channel family protein [Fibrobacterota bacterium]